MGKEILEEIGVNFAVGTRYKKEREMGKELIYMGIAELTAKIESLSAEDYNMVIMLDWNNEVSKSSFKEHEGEVCSL